MRENGLKDNPTMEKCKKIKKKLDKKKEVAELDLDNIIEDSGRGRRNVYSLYANTSGLIGHLQTPLKKSRIKRPTEDSDSDIEMLQWFNFKSIL